MCMPLQPGKQDLNIAEIRIFGVENVYGSSGDDAIFGSDNSNEINPAKIIKTTVEILPTNTMLFSDASFFSVFRPYLCAYFN